MAIKHEFYDDYWKAKRIPVENIPERLPVYILMSYSSMFHTYGSYTVFRDAPAKNKWLRVHPYQEWHV